jgi:putative membrane protein
MGYVFSLGYWVATLVVFTFYVLVSLEVIAEEIEDPFNMDNNDIPTLKLARNISRNVKDILAS